MDETQEKQVVKELFITIAYLSKQLRSVIFGLNLWVILSIFMFMKSLPFAIFIAVVVAILAIMDMIMVGKALELAKIRAQQFTPRV